MAAVVDFNILFAFFLVLIRISGIVFLIPIFGDFGVPDSVKVLLAVVLAWFFFQVHTPAPVSFEALRPLELTLFVVKEFILAVTLGYMFRLAFHVVSGAAEALSQTAGFSASRLFNPQLGYASSVLTDLLFLLVVFMFFATRSDVLVFRVMDLVMEKIPLGEVQINESLLQSLISTGGLALQLAVRLSGPFILCMLMVNLGLGIAGRVVPTLNVMALSFTVTLIISVWLVGLFMPYYLNAVDGLFGTTEILILELVKVLGG